MRLLWVCSDETVCAAGDIASLENLGDFEVDCADTANAGIDALRVSVYDAVLTDLPLTGWTAEEWLEQVQRMCDSPVLFRHRDGTCAEAVRLARLGAQEYFDRGTGLDEIARCAESAAARATVVQPDGAEPWRDILVGEGRAMEAIADLIRLVGPRRSTVLITGETGTGKELVAHAIHQASPRRNLPLVALNCNSVPDTLLDAELFGHVRGAFTGAIATRAGRFEQAHRSTLFLDEIGDMPVDLQSKLLRALQEREVQRLGSGESLRLDVRVVAATNADLGDRIRNGKFREDLFYRLNVISLQVPPLRDRREDIPALVDHFVERVCREEDLPAKRIVRDAMSRLCDYWWPGNVRQLQNAVETAVVLSGERRDLYPSDFPLEAPVARKPVAVPASAPAIRLPDDGMDFESVVGHIERSILEQALRRTRGNKKAAAEMLRLKRTTLSAKLKSLEAAAG